jgi:hypothetical protein
MSRLKIILVWTVLTLVLLSLLLVYVAVGKNSSNSAIMIPNLMQASRQELRELPFCYVAQTYGVPANVIAGVVLAEKQLNRDWSDAVQDGLFAILLYLRGNDWWQEWSERSLALASEELEARTKSSEWSRDVNWTGIIFSIGPAQVTPRTALRACKNAAKQPAWCSGTKPLIEALLSESRSLEVAALILDDERKTHLRETGVDVAEDSAKWATLYNFGGDIFRARFDKDPNRGPNRFGKWVGDNRDEMDGILQCVP